MHSILVRIWLLLMIVIIAFPLWYFTKELFIYLRRAGNTFQDHINQAKQHIDKEEVIITEEDDNGEEDSLMIPEEYIIVNEPQIPTETMTGTTDTPMSDPNPVAPEEDLSPETIESTEPTAPSPEKIAQQIDDIKYAALTYKERGKLDEYEKKLIEGIALVGNNEEFMGMLIDHYFEAGQYVKSSTLLRKLIQLNPTNHKALRQLGQIYLHDKDPDTARLLFEKARELKEEHPKYLISLIELYYEMGELNEAIHIVDKLSRLRPANTDYLLTLAKLYEEVNQPTKAHAYYMKVLEVNPLHNEAKKALKRLL